jgi:hypothetical protein
MRRVVARAVRARRRRGTRIDWRLARYTGAEGLPLAHRLARRFGTPPDMLADTWYARTLPEFRAIAALGGEVAPWQLARSAGSRIGAWAAARFPRRAAELLEHEGGRVADDVHRAYARAIAKYAPGSWTQLEDGWLRVRAKGALPFQLASVRFYTRRAELPDALPSCAVS